MLDTDLSYALRVVNTGHTPEASGSNVRNPAAEARSEIAGAQQLDASAENGSIGPGPSHYKPLAVTSSWVFALLGSAIAIYAGP